MNEPVPCVLAPRWGEPHRYIDKGKPGGLYKPVAFALNVRTKQDQIVYVGLTGADKGLWFVGPLDDWTFRFELLEAEKPAESTPSPEIPDRGEAGVYTAGSGV